MKPKRKNTPAKRLSRLETDVLKCSRSHDLFSPGDKVLVAVSGGSDSVALLRLLHHWKLTGRLPLELTLVHLNHALRPGADTEQKFVRDLAARLGLPCICRKKNIRQLARRWKMGIEQASRRARYEFFAATARRLGACSVATGHTADDNSETVLMHLLRGAAHAGLAGIAHTRQLEKNLPGVRLVRPLLEVRRDRLQLYLNRRGQPWCTDASNLDRRYLRNRIRHDLLPLLEADYSPAIGKRLANLAGLFSEVARMVDHLCKGAWSEVIDTTKAGHMTVDLSRLTELPPLVAKSILRQGLIESGVRPDRLGRDHLEKIWQLATGKKTKGNCQLPDGIGLVRRGTELVISRTAAVPAVSWRARQVAVPGQTRCLKAGFIVSFKKVDRKCFNPESFYKTKSPDEELLDACRLGHCVIIRPRRGGDRMHPLGAPGSRKLKDILTDAGKSTSRGRPNIVMEDHRGRIAWVWPVRIAEHVKVTPRTRQFIYVKVSWNK